MSETNRPLIRSQCDRDGGICPIRLASVLDLPPAVLAQALGVGEAELTGYRPYAPETQIRLDGLVDVLDRSLARCGSPPAAWYWASSAAIPSLGDRTAVELIREDRASAVLAYVDRTNAGGFA